MRDACCLFLSNWKSMIWTYKSVVKVTRIKTLKCCCSGDGLIPWVLWHPDEVSHCFPMATIPNLSISVSADLVALAAWSWGLAFRRASRLWPSMTPSLTCSTWWENLLPAKLSKLFRVCSINPSIPTCCHVGMDVCCLGANRKLNLAVFVFFLITAQKIPGGCTTCFYASLWSTPHSNVITVIPPASRFTCSSTTPPMAVTVVKCLQIMANLSSMAKPSLSSSGK